MTGQRIQQNEILETHKNLVKTKLRSDPARRRTENESGITDEQYYTRLNEQIIKYELCTTFFLFFKGVIS